MNRLSLRNDWLKFKIVGNLLIGLEEYVECTIVGPISKFCDTNLVPISYFFMNFTIGLDPKYHKNHIFNRYGMSMNINLVKIKPKGINIEYHGSDTSGVCNMVWY